MENIDGILSEIVPEETEATSIQSFLTRLIDYAIDLLLLFLLYVLLPRDTFLSITENFILILIIVIALAAVYRFLFLMLFNKTIGMLVCNVKLLNKNLKPLSEKEKLKSVFRTRFSSIRYYKEI